MLFFAYYFLDYVKYPFAPFHVDYADDLKDLLDGTITELVWCTTRDSAKSSFAKGWALWMAANEVRRYYNQVSAVETNSKKFLFDLIVQMQTNVRFRKDYGELFNAPPSFDVKQSKAVDGFNTTNGIRYEAHTTQQSPRGFLYESFRPGWTTYDDFENLKIVRSESEIKNVAEHLSEAKAGIEQPAGRILYLCNYLSDTGNVAALKKRAAQDQKIRFREVKRILPPSPPAFISSPSWPARDVMTDEELLLPGNEHKISIESVKRSMWSPETGDADFMRECQLEPVDPMGDGPDEKQYIALYPLDLRTNSVVDEQFHMQGQRCLGIDPAGDGKDEAVWVVRSPFQAKVELVEKKSDPKSSARRTIEIMEKYGIAPQNVVVDSFGIGLKLVMELSSLGYRIKAVNVGEHDHIDLFQDTSCLNDRAWAFFKSREWLASGGRLCYDSGWREEMRCIRHRENEKHVRQIIPKKEIIKRGFKSPGRIDAFMLTFFINLAMRSRAVKTSDDKPISRFL